MRRTYQHLNSLTIYMTNAIADIHHHHLVTATVIVIVMVIVIVIVIEIVIAIIIVIAQVSHAPLIPHSAMECAPHEAPPLSGYGQPNQYRSHHELPIAYNYQAKRAPMRRTRSAEWVRSCHFPSNHHEPENFQDQEHLPIETQHSNEPDAAPSEIILMKFCS